MKPWLEKDEGKDSGKITLFTIFGCVFFCEKFENKTYMTKQFSPSLTKFKVIIGLYERPFFKKNPQPTIVHSLE